jgi:hypothetical protein
MGSRHSPIVISLLLILSILQVTCAFLVPPSMPVLKTLFAPGTSAECRLPWSCPDISGVLQFFLFFFSFSSKTVPICRAAFSCLLKSKCDNILTKASALRVNLNLDGAPIASNSHTHPSHSQTSRLLTSSLSLGVPVPRPTQCTGGA